MRNYDVIVAGGGFAGTAAAIAAARAESNRVLLVERYKAKKRGKPFGSPRFFIFAFL